MPRLPAICHCKLLLMLCTGNPENKAKIKTQQRQSGASPLMCTHGEHGILASAVLAPRTKNILQSGNTTFFSIMSLDSHAIILSISFTQCQCLSTLLLMSYIT
jgi:hypothetical protein